MKIKYLLMETLTAVTALENQWKSSNRIKSFSVKVEL